MGGGSSTAVSSVAKLKSKYEYVVMEEVKEEVSVIVHCT
jgi:hypothetical protein